MSAWLLLSLGCGNRTSGPHPVEALTGAHTRLVWLQDAWDHVDVFSDAGQVRLMSLDSRDGRGEQVRVPGPAPLRKPLISPCGEWIVYSRDDDASVWALPWEDDTPLRITEGVALDVVRDAADETLWIYVGREPVDPGVNVAYGEVHRVNLSDPDQAEQVWDGPPVGRDNFQVSADGRLAGALFPWPDAGFADLENGTWEQIGRGCWTGLSPTSPSLMWILDGAHRNLNLNHAETRERWTVPLAQHEAIGGHEIYHPRWSSHPSYLVMSGPYKIRKGGNNIRGGGADVQLHVGRFAEDWQSIEAWAQVTDNEHANFFPDVWVRFDAETRADLRSAPDRSDAEETLAARIVELEVRLLEKTPTPTLADIAPYTQGLAAHSYEVISAPGDFPYERILIAHWVIRDRETLPPMALQPGEQTTFTVTAYDEVPELEGERLVMDVEDLLLPLFYEK
ncbi:MAG: hypothetical protein LAT83_15005 [Kiritimatiellae bacterium]|nr:hypothetical protein [Kiritimatiellia bacterium]